jgi:hypothetical protein
MHRLAQGKAAAPNALFQLAREGAILTSAFGRRGSQLLRTLGMDGRDLDYGDADRRSRAQE